MKQLALITIGLFMILAGHVKASEYHSMQEKNTLGAGVGIVQDSILSNTAKRGRFIGNITFTRLDIGLVKLIDNGSFSLSATNDFLDYIPWKTSTVSFDVLQLGYRFTPHFKIYTAAGLDWTLLRLDRNITIQKNKPTLQYIEEPIKFSKNRFSSTYVHIPLNFELRTKENDNGKRFRLVVGPEIAFLIGGKVKQVSEERGKVKYRDNYNFTPFRYGATVRMGYGGLGIFAKYYANDMFDSAPQAGLKNMAFGVTFGLN